MYQIYEQKSKKKEIKPYARKEYDLACFHFNLIFMCQMCRLNLGGFVESPCGRIDLELYWIACVVSKRHMNGHDENSTNKHHIRRCNVHWKSDCRWTWQIWCRQGITKYDGRCTKFTTTFVFVFALSSIFRLRFQFLINILVWIS